MSSYISAMPGVGKTGHNWRVDLSQRLNWLYGSAHDRIKTYGPDLTAWRNLGRRRAA